jgi:uncharacterized NAD-dependent epimerase/dehydratase family protein
MPVFKSKAALAVLLAFTAAGCTREGEITTTGILATRSACP